MNLQLTMDLTRDPKTGKILNEKSPYNPSDHEKDRISLIRNSMVIGVMNMTTPRREFNDLSLIERLSVDRMSWNTYSPNDGQPYVGDPINAWKSNAIKPVTRNKVISIAAHATAAVIFPKVFAESQDSDEDKDAAQVMRDLIEWSAQQSKYPRTFVYAVINALVDPVAVVHTEYCETYRTVKMPNPQGGFTEKKILDDQYSGFIDTMVQASELYIENFYENDIQKQGFLIVRRVIMYSTAKTKYGDKENFQYVHPGMQVVYSDANLGFYYVYDPNLTGDSVEEVQFFSRNMDLQLTVVNGILMSDPDQPNPRMDKKYPFAKTGYELIDGGRCFYYKSLVFKMGPDERVVNQLYPMIVDGTYLAVFPPMYTKGGEDIGGDVIVPGAVTNLAAPDADLRPITTNNNLNAGMMTLNNLISSMNEDSQDPAAMMMMGGRKSAYQINLMQQNAKTEMSLFLKMIGNVVEDFGNLRMSDIIQYLTIADVAQIAGRDILKYKSFLMAARTGKGTSSRKSRKIQFDLDMPTEPMSEEQMLEQSFKLMELEGGPDSNKEIWKVNPMLFTQLKFKTVISPDVLSPLSDEIQHSFNLEAYDRLIQNPIIDQEQVTKDFLLASYEISMADPDKYIAKSPAPGAPGAPGAAPGGAPGQQGNSPSASDIMNKVAQSSGGGAPVPMRTNG